MSRAIDRSESGYYWRSVNAVKNCPNCGERPTPHSGTSHGICIHCRCGFYVNGESMNDATDRWNAGPWSVQPEGFK